MIILLFVDNYSFPKFSVKNLILCFFNNSNKVLLIFRGVFNSLMSGLKVESNILLLMLKIYFKVLNLSFPLLSETKEMNGLLNINEKTVP